jgi:hypothetical protein
MLACHCFKDTGRRHLDHKPLTLLFISIVAIRAWVLSEVQETPVCSEKNKEGQEILHVQWFVLKRKTVE